MTLRPSRAQEEYEALNAETDEDPTCPHGLSEWLCADPVNHYPTETR